MVKVLILKNDSKVLISEIREVGAEIGEPNCELTNPVEFRLARCPPAEKPRVLELGR